MKADCTCFTDVALSLKDDVNPVCNGYTMTENDSVEEEGHEKGPGSQGGSGRPGGPGGPGGSGGPGNSGSPGGSGRPGGPGGTGGAGGPKGSGKDPAQGISQESLKTSSDFCKDPMQVIEKARIKLPEIIVKVKVMYHGVNENQWISSTSSSWTMTHDKILGSCYTLDLSSIRLPNPIDLIVFTMKMNANFMVHSKGSFSNQWKKDYYFYNKTEFPVQTFQLDYDVFHMLNQGCSNDANYEKDDCLDSTIFEESIKKVGCTWPWLKNQSKICTDETKSQEAKDIGTDILKGNIATDCPDSCSYIKATYSTRMMGSTAHFIKFSFPQSIKVFEAYYDYDEISLIAEVGGYVGLFLGWSVFQLADMIELIFNSFRKLF